MKYSKYFKGILHNDGLPQLNAKEWARMMNIAALEYGITRLEKVREMNQNNLLILINPYNCYVVTV
jgi:hypothetical protein